MTSLKSCTRLRASIGVSDKGIMEKKMETLGPFKGIILGFCWGYKGIMEKKMETITLGLGFRV